MAQKSSTEDTIVVPDWKTNWRKKFDLLALQELDWVRLPGALEIAQMGRAHFLKIAVEKGEIRSFLLKQKPDALKGIRLFNVQSIKDYLNRKAHEAELASKREAIE